MNRFVRIGRRPRPDAAAGAPATGVACRAPFGSMYLDQRGWVRACCMNTFHTLGNVTERSLLDIWRGEAASRLRRAMEALDLTLGCDACKWQVDNGRPHLAYSRWFNELGVNEADPAWPVQLELSISNTCNLQCVMCNGEWSSSIRAQREGLAPLPKVYGDRFFDELRPFLPHLQRVKFLGGEPFLAAETLRMMDLMVSEGVAPRCHVTTNGSQWTPRVERILEMLPVDVAVSVDAATEATHEAIRVGSSWSGLQRNLDLLQATAARRGTDVSLTYCLMTENWHEFLQFCRQADERGVTCAVNTVTDPDRFSLLKLDEARLAEVVAGMEALDASEGHLLGASRATWTGELQRMQAHLRDRREGVEVIGVDATVRNPLLPAPALRSTKGDRAGRVRELLDEADRCRAEVLPPVSSRVDVSAEGIVTAIEPPDEVLGVPSADIVGRSVDEATARIVVEYGTDLHSYTLVETEAVKASEITYPNGRKLIMVTAPVVESDGTVVGARLDLGWAAEDAG